MPAQRPFYCTACAVETDHRLVASTRLHIGRKQKWACLECAYQTVRIEGEGSTTD